VLSDIQKSVINLFTKNPLQYAKWLGFNKLTDLHNKWMVDFINEQDDQTLQAHRGSYKTTCLSISIAIIMILFPNKDIIFSRKTDTDVAEIMEQVANILQHPITQHLANILYGKNFNVLSNKSQASTDLRTTAKGSSQLLGIGIKGSVTGKHADIVITDDIVNLKDRISSAERKYTKQFYMELQNIKNRGGRFINTGTPWHKEDAFSIMPEADKYSCYDTGLMSKEEVDKLRSTMTNSLFAANYELKHIADEDALFKQEPKFFNDKTLIENGIGHIDASYGGADSSAFTIGNKIGDNYYLYGKKRDTHIDNCINDFIMFAKDFKCGIIWMEDNGDKGYLKKEVKELGHPAETYHESENKYIKISSYLKMNWENVYFYEGTDPEYIEQILDYSQDAAHDDCPDSASSIIRKLKNKLIIG
jgi:predicted phage terminase large subunit-like protein